MDPAVATDESGVVSRATTPALGNSTLPYQGGPIVQNAHVRVILIGNDFANAATAFQYGVAQWKENITDIVNSPHFYAPLAQYSAVNGAPGVGRLDGPIRTVSYTFPDSGVYMSPYCTGHTPCAQQRDYLPILESVAAGDVPDDNAIYMLVIDPQASFPTNIGGDHSALQLSNGTWIRWGVSYYSSVYFSHELSEAITDPYPQMTGLLHPPAYYNPNSKLSEVGDLCLDAQDATLDGVAVQEEYSILAGGCVGYAQMPELTGGNLFGTGALTYLSPTPIPADSSFVVLSNQYWTNNPGIGQPVIYGITEQNGIEYKYFNNTGDWAAWAAPAQTGWVSKIAATSTSGRAFYDVIGIGGDGNVWWRPSGGLADIGGWSQIGTFQTADVAAISGNGGLALYALGTDGQVRYQLVSGTNSPTTSWTILGGLPGAATSFAAYSLGGKAEVVANVGNSANPYISRVSLVRGWNGWLYGQQPFVSAGSSLWPGNGAVHDIVLGMTGAGSSGGERLAVALSTDGGVLIGIDDNADRTKLAGSWRKLGFTNPMGELAMANLADGRMAVFGLDDAHHLEWQPQNSLADSDWSAVSNLGGMLSTVQAFTWPNGLIEVYGLDEITHQVAHDYQVQGTGAAYWAY